MTKRHGLGILPVLALAATVITTTGCDGMSQFKSTTSAASVLSAKETSLLAVSSTAEVQEDESCQTEEPDFAAVKEKLVAKLTALVAKLEARDTSSLTEEQLAKHDDLLSKVNADLATISSATELTDEVKEIIRRAWHPPKHGHMGRRMGPPPPGGFSECGAKVREGGRNNHCVDLERLLSLADLSESLREALQARFDEVCAAGATTTTE